MDSLFDFSLSEYIGDTIIDVETNEITNPFARTYEYETEETLKRRRYIALQQLKEIIKENNQRKDKE